MVSITVAEGNGGKEKLQELKACILAHKGACPVELKLEGRTYQLGEGFLLDAGVSVIEELKKFGEVDLK